MTLPKNFIASVWLAAALAGVAVITAAVGQTTSSNASPGSQAHSNSASQAGGESGH